MHLNISQLIEQYGYLALFFGCIAEGETFTLLGGVAAHEGLLHYGWTVLVAIIGGTIGDTVLYLIGRHYGDRILNRFKKHQPQIHKAQRWIQKYPIWFVIGVRFMYGLRIVGPIIIGASHLKLRRFLPLNILGAIIWAFIFVTLGYAGGGVIGPLLHKFSHPLKYIFLLVLVFIAALILRRLWRNYKKNNHHANEGE
ncbi:membrane protein DedA, SNARE-associated domain [Izhakiella capsodis]|uniref:Membrane protein DedA, SNARE-associated domain n=1 Tax=Izhakiella capsodis TaxID=1367852 RepID=A0A1I4UGS1_9GAMM|nr:DedA family protein [Izhakiella capsodis]SFM88168.1 membrane protein DedA, SNARE-associated domain [Izhakiella capsodis]